jgi:WD40 repeat protein
VAYAAFSADGKAVLTAGARDKTVRRWDAETRLVQAVLEGHADAVRFVGEGSDGTVVSLSRDGVAKLWDAEGNPTASFRWAPEAVELPAYAANFALSPDGKRLAVGYNEVVSVWDLTKAKKAK